jgi:hypothetical protein
MRCKSLCAVALVLAAGVAAADQAERAELLDTILGIDNWNESRFAKFFDEQPISIDEQFEMIRLATRLDSLDAGLFVVEAPGDSLAAIVANLNNLRGSLVALRGRAVEFEAIELAAADAEKLSHRQVYLTRVVDDSGAAAAVLSLEVPRAWQSLGEIDTPVAVGGVVVKLGQFGDEMQPVIVAPRLAWFPNKAQPPAVNHGKATLGILGYDAAQLDHVSQRDRFTRRESAAFYALLDVVAEQSATKLVDYATRNTRFHHQFWAERAAGLGGNEVPADAAIRKQWKLAQTAAAAAREQRYSVAPFFNEPDQHVGELVVLDGLVRRAVRIDLAGGLAGQVDSAAAQHDVRYYYELDLFTADSQNNPVVFCVRDLPAGFPTGKGLREEVRVAGFFFKNWGYNARSDAGTDGPSRRLAPLFVGRGPLLIVPAESPFPWSLVVGSGFVAIVGLMWWTIWRWNRGDREYEQRIRQQLHSDEPIFPE